MKQEVCVPCTWSGEGERVTGRWHPDKLHLLGDTRGALLKSVTVSALCGGDLLLTLELSEK